MKHWMFSCKDVTQKVSQSMDVKLPFHHHMAIRIHLLMCRYCARFHRQLMMLRKMSRHPERYLPDSQIPDNLSQETKERMKATLRSLP